MITEWADGVLFATRKIITCTEEQGFGQKRTITSGNSLTAATASSGAWAVPPASRRTATAWRRKYS